MLFCRHSFLLEANLFYVTLNRWFFEYLLSALRFSFLIACQQSFISLSFVFSTKCFIWIRVLKPFTKFSKYHCWLFFFFESMLTNLMKKSANSKSFHNWVFSSNCLKRLQSCYKQVHVEGWINEKLEGFANVGWILLR